MYRQGYDVEAIRRFGRWSSDAVHAYPWETHDKQKGLAQLMVAEQGPLTVTTQLRRRQAAPGSTALLSRGVQLPLVWLGCAPRDNYGLVVSGAQWGA